MESIVPITSGGLVQEKLTVFPVKKTRTLRSMLDSDDKDDQERPSSRTYLVITAVMLVYFGQLVTLVGAGAQGQTIAAHFHGTSSVVWLTAPVAIGTTVLGPIVAQAADYWGRRGLLVMLTSMGAVGSVIVSRATSMNMAISGFCVIGIAFGAQPLLHTITSEVLPRRYRGWAQAADMTANSLGATAGLLVGAALNRTNDPLSQGFRKYFLFNMASYAASVLLCLVVYNPPARATQTEFTNLEKLAKLDWPGYFLLLTGLLLFSVGLSFSNNPYKWSDPRVFATFVVGLTACGCLVVYAWRFKKDGMFHHVLFTRNRNFSLANICVFAEGVAFIAANNYFAFQANLMYETDSLMVGLRYSVMLLVAMCSAAATGWYCAVYRKVRWITVVAFLIFTAFFVCMATTTPGSGKPVWFYGILLGTSLGMTLTTLVVIAQLSTPPEMISVASGLIISTRSLGGTVGLAIYNAVFNSVLSRMAANIAKATDLDPATLENFIPALQAHNHTTLQALPGVTGEIISKGEEAMLNTFVVAFRNVWISAGCFVAFGAVVAAFHFDPEKEFNMHIDSPMAMKDKSFAI